MARHSIDRSQPESQRRTRYLLSCEGDALNRGLKSRAEGARGKKKNLKSLQECHITRILQKRAPTEGGGTHLRSYLTAHRAVLLLPAPNGQPLCLPIRAIGRRQQILPPSVSPRARQKLLPVFAHLASDPDQPLHLPLGLREQQRAPALLESQDQREPLRIRERAEPYPRPEHGLGREHLQPVAAKEYKPRNE